MARASERLYGAIVDQRLTLPDDPELARHASNVIAKHNRRGWRISKPDDRTPSTASPRWRWRSTGSVQPETVELVGWL